MVKNLPTMQKTWVQSLGWEDPLEKRMATHSSILAWRTPWTEEPGQLQSMGLQRIGHDLGTNTYTHTRTHTHTHTHTFLSSTVVFLYACQSRNGLEFLFTLWGPGSEADYPEKAWQCAFAGSMKEVWTKPLRFYRPWTWGLLFLYLVSRVITPKSLLPNFYCLSSCKQHRASGFLPLRKLFGFMNSKCWSWKNLKPKE